MTYSAFIQAFSTWERDKKMLFFERLLSDMTIMNRAIWSEPNCSDQEIVEALKWSNEFSHRIWNLLRDLRRGEQEKITERFSNHLLFHMEHNALLRRHLSPTVKATYAYISQSA